MDFMQPQRMMTVEEYIQQLNGDIKRAAVQDLIDEALFGLPDMMRHFYCEKPDLRIRIQRDPLPDASASSLAQMVVLNEGMIDHCLAAQFGTLDEVFSNGHSIESFDYKLIPHSMLAWVVVHEMTHIYRCHEEVADIYGKSSKLVSQTLESDADMFAAAYIYRMVQRKMKSAGGVYPVAVNDFAVRQFSLYSVFWALRLLVVCEGQGTHLPLGPRLFSIIQKLASINEEESAPLPSDILMSERGRRWTQVLMKTLNRFERIFREKNGDQSLDLMGQIKDYLESGYHRRIERKWNHMREDVSLLSGSVA